MIILFSPERELNHEQAILNQLFEAGLECFHLRKPHMTFQEHWAYLAQIEPEHHAKIMVHQFHEVTETFALKGIHFKEKDRIDGMEKELLPPHQAISTSFHCPQDLQNHSFEFDYQFLSPVFSSISKSGYEGKGFEVHHISKKVIALGGIHLGNIGKVKKMGYQGIGVLGSVWQHPDPVSQYKQLATTFQNSSV